MLLAFACDSAVGFTGLVAFGATCGGAVASCEPPAKACVGVSATNIAAERSRNDFNITSSSQRDVGKASIRDIRDSGKDYRPNFEEGPCGITLRIQFAIR
jgi:hypothetical protein